MSDANEWGYPTETIGGLTFCTWAELKKDDQKSPGVSTYFLTVGSVISLLWLSTLMINGLSKDANWGQPYLRYFVYGLFATMYAGTLFALYLQKRAPKAKQEQFPQGVPSRAISVSARIGGHENYGSADGWLWFEGRWLCFRGDRFGFLLQRSDFRNKNPRFGGPLFLTLPKGFPSRCIWIVARPVLGAHDLQDRTVRHRLDLDLEGWASFQPTKEPRLYPPMRSGWFLSNPGRLVFSWMPLGFITGSCCYIASFYVPYEFASEFRRAAFFLGGFVAGLMPLILVNVWVARRLIDYEVKRAIIKFGS